MNLRPHTLAAVPVALAVLALPAAAPADPSPAPEHFVTYSADVNAKVQHGFFSSYSGDFSSGSRNVDWSARVSSHIDQLTFRKRDEGVDLLSNGSADANAKTAGAITAKSQQYLEGTKTQTCESQGAPDWGDSRISPSLLSPLGGDQGIDFQLASSPRIEWKCSQPELGASSGLTYDDTGRAPYDMFFTMPKEAVGAGEFIQLINGPSGQAAGYCPDGNLPDVKQCTFSWSGKIVMFKTGETIISTEPDPDGSQQAGGGAPAAPGPQQPSATTGGSANTGGRPRAEDVKVDPKTGDVVFAATCPTACSGAAAVSVPRAGSAKGSAAAAPKPLATLRFAVKGGTKSTVRLRFPARAKKAMRRAGRAKVKVTLTPKGGKAATRTFAVKVRKRGSASR